MPFDSLYGNAKLKATAFAELSSGKPSHAYILEGPTGSGKHTAARLIASALFCKEKDAPCGKCLSCRKIAEDIMTDVIFVGRGERATIGVDTIREIRSSLSFAPVEEDRKVYIIEEADKMTAQAQNSLLLSLEEPPEFVTFILLCTDSTLLLETVRSRAPVIRMEVFPAEEIVDYLSGKKEYEKYAADGKLRVAASASGGAIGRAISLLKEKNAEEFRDAALCREIMPTLLFGRLAERNALLSKLPAKRDEALRFFVVLLSALRDVMTAKKTEDSKPLFYADRDEAKRLSERVSAKRLVALYDAAQLTIQRISSNVNIQASEGLFLTAN